MSTLAPCVVGHHRVNMLLVSNLTTTLALLLGLQFMTLTSPLVQRESEEVIPITQCIPDFLTKLETPRKCIFRNETVSHCEAISTWNALTICGGKDCQPYRRVCSTSESVNDLLFGTVIPVLCSLLLLGLIACSALTWLSDYFNMFKACLKLFQ